MIVDLVRPSRIFFMKAVLSHSRGMKHRVPPRDIAAHLGVHYEP
jgi:hypothetical protein